MWQWAFSFFLFFPSILQWPKSGIVNSNGAPELKFLCVFWIVIREFIQPLFYRRNIFWETIWDVRPVGGCWVTYDSQILLQKSLDFCITVHGGLFQNCLLKSTLRCLNGAWGTLTVAINEKKLEACNSSFGMLIFNSCCWLLCDSFMFHEDDEFHGRAILP